MKTAYGMKELLASCIQVGECLVYSKQSFATPQATPWKGKPRRAMWFLSYGELPAKKCIYATCATPMCVNIKHLVAERRLGRLRNFLSDEDRFLSNLTTAENGCVQFRSGHVGNNGYQIFKAVHTEPSPWGTMAHRAAWYFSHGPIPKGMFICHKCNNRICVNVDHLYLGDAASNGDDVARGMYRPSRKLTSEQARAAKAAIASGVNLNRVAVAFNVRRSIIRQIREGDTYKYD